MHEPVYMACKIKATRDLKPQSAKLNVSLMRLIISALFLLQFHFLGFLQPELVSAPSSRHMLQIKERNQSYWQNKEGLPLPEICGSMGVVVVGNTAGRSCRLAVAASTVGSAVVGPMDFSSMLLWSFLPILLLFLQWL